MNGLHTKPWVRPLLRTTLLFEVGLFCGPRALGVALVMVAYFTLEPWLLSEGGAR